LFYRKEADSDFMSVLINEVGDEVRIQVSSNEKGICININNGNASYQF
jgi:hypothetical protein